MDDSNSIITFKEYREFKRGKRSVKIKQLFHEFTLFIVKELLEEFEEKGFDFEVLRESNDIMRLKAISKTKYKTIEDYLNLAFPLIICTKKQL